MKEKSLNETCMLQYILDEDDNFWIINEIGKKIKGYLLYRHDLNGNKYNKSENKRYIKLPNNGLVDMPERIKKIYDPREFYLSHKKELFSPWSDVVEVLNEIGINDKDIGIFGSYLIGFDIIKDVDFVIYGLDNLKKVYQNIDYIRKKLNATKISNEHVEYQYNKHKANFNSNTDLKKIISKNWSGLQFENGVLSTLRFIDINNIKIPDYNGVKKKIECEVIEGLSSACIPRHIKVLIDDKIYDLFSSQWRYQSFAENGDKLEIYGTIDELKKLIILNDKEDYIKFI